MCGEVEMGLNEIAIVNAGRDEGIESRISRFLKIPLVGFRRICDNIAEPYDGLLITLDFTRFLRGGFHETPDFIG